MRKIVIIPSFADYHLLKCWISNILEVLEPDYILINVGLFPRGPENKTPIDSSFRSRWCHMVQPNAGFDLSSVLDMVYKHSFDGLHIQVLNYNSTDANDCFIEAISNFADIEIQEGDIIFPLEPDAFVLEGDMEIINSEISKLKPGEGVSCKWVDFLETQYYTEAINIVQPKYRRFAYCFDNIENYKAAMCGFMSQNYSKLRKVDSFFIRHYCWFQPEPYKQLRFELIYRSDPKYWKQFDSGLTEIRRRSIEYEKWETAQLDEMPNVQRVTIRPSRFDDGRYAQFININHPKHIQSHPNFVRLDFKDE